MATKYSVNIIEDDAKLFYRIKAKVERRARIRVPAIEIVRLALNALAKQEGIK